MKSTLRILGVLLTLAASMGVVSAQCNEPMDAAVRNQTTSGYARGNAWGCPTTGNTGSPDCGIKYFFYGTGATSNGNLNATADGNPVYVTNGNGSYRSDVENSSNYYGALHPCGVPMYIVWDGALDTDTGDHKGFYGSQGQLVDAGEFGNIFAACGGTTRAVSCFPVLNGQQAGDVGDTPQGTLLSQGGFEPIPPPRVQTYDRVSGDIILAWDEPLNYRSEEGAPSNIVGMDIFVVEDAGVLDSRGLDAPGVEAGARFVGHAALPALSITLNDGTSPECTGGSPPATCVTAGTGSLIPVSKVAYAPNAGVGGPVTFNAFSANGPVVLIDTALFTEVVNFRAAYLGKARGMTSFELSWDTVAEDSLQGFVLKRGTSLNGPFSRITGVIEPLGEGEGAHYAVTDTFRPQGDREFFYLLEVLDTDANAAPQTVGPVRAMATTGPRLKPGRSDD